MSEHKNAASGAGRTGPPRPKPLNQQVIVITGASSGIGLATARMAAARGARVVLNSRDETDLRSAVEQITASGGKAIFVVADVADREGMRRAAERAVQEFGGIDTWVNNAGVSIYGFIEDVPLEDAERLFQTNYFGVVNGTLAALPYLKRRAGEDGSATVLINTGSVLSDTPVPLQGHYSASKHAVRAFTDALRMEIEYQKVPVFLSLIQPSAINTPYPEHAGNYLGVEPKHAPPVYAPELVAEAILSCAVRPQRSVRVGGAAKFFALTEAFAPQIGDKFKEAVQIPGTYSDKPPKDDSILHAPRPHDSRVHGNYEGHVRQTSVYTAAKLHPLAAGTIVAAAAGLTIAALSRRAAHNGHNGHNDRAGRMARSNRSDEEATRGRSQSPGPIMQVLSGETH